MTTYLLDANIFVQAKNLHYGFDFCPAFWQLLIEQNDVGRAASIDKFFLRPDDRVFPALRTVTNWAKVMDTSQWLFPLFCRMQTTSEQHTPRSTPASAGAA